MRSFTIGNYRIDIVSHSRVFNPRRMQGGVTEAFEIDCYDVSSGKPVPFDWYPNAKRHPHPDRPQRQTFHWDGPQFVDVYAGFDGDTRLSDQEARERVSRGEQVKFRKVDVKRGADFRSRFWPSIMRRIRKVEAARRAGKTIGDVTEEEIDKTALEGPVDMRGMALNEAVEALTGEQARITTQIPRGTVANIDTDYDARSSPTAKNEIGGVLTPGGSDEGRIAIRFPLSTVPSGATINDADFQVNIVFSAGVTGDDTVNVNAYNNNGVADPAADAAATCHSRCGGTTLVNSGTAYQSNGSKTLDLGTTADGQIENNIDSPDRWSVGLVAVNWDGDETFFIEAIEAIGTDPATLIVDYTEAGPEPQAVAGSLPAMQGVLTKAMGFALAGSLPAMSGALSLGVSTTVAGNLPPQSGDLSVKLAYDLAGTLPPMDGDVAFLKEKAFLAGSLPAMQGDLSIAAAIAVLGDLPAMSGALFAGQTAEVAGVLPAMSGDAAFLRDVVKLAGSLPPMQGAIVKAMAAELAGSLPAMSGEISIEAFLAVLGNLPAMSGVVVSARPFDVSGELPAMAGLIGHRHTEMHLLGILPPMSGTAGKSVEFAVAGALPQMAGLVAWKRLLPFVARAVARLVGIPPEGHARATAPPPAGYARRKDD